ncbi:hypothetical protein NDU88_002874 [Pleurodeles waltl]|uniref:Uncharacterized protein n=1 Tax=Pleurodeles waltl TaxID=8319 RepID=A0AAV7M5H2_PLEWA|nr:hypothetical protein NDU88_002874 [Pleurodeles waltl]
MERPCDHLFPGPIADPTPRQCNTRPSAMQLGRCMRRGRRAPRGLSPGVIWEPFLSFWMLVPTSGTQTAHTTTKKGESGTPPLLTRVSWLRHAKPAVRDQPHPPFAIAPDTSPSSGLRPLPIPERGSSGSLRGGGITP